MAEAVQKKDSEAKSAFAEYDYSNFYYGAGEDPLNLLGPFSNWYKEALPAGYYLYSEPLQSAPDTSVRVKNRKGDEIGEKAFYRLVVQHAPGTTQTMLGSLKSALEAFAAGEPFPADLSIVSLSRRRSA